MSEPTVTPPPDLFADVPEHIERGVCEDPSNAGHDE